MQPLPNIGHELSQISFKASQEAAFRRLIRDSIKRGSFTKSERDVTLTVINHWLHHKGGAKPFIHPSREAIAKKAGVSIRTVASCFGMLRAAGILVPVSGIRGGKGKATQYKVDARALMVLCGCDWLDEFITGRLANCTVSLPNLHAITVQKLHTVLYDDKGYPSQRGENP
jgi:hypothetical protein